MERPSESTDFAPQSWFEAWFEGNLLVPQYSSGNLIFVLAAILEDADGVQHLRDDLEQTLSPEQLVLARNYMDGVHRAHGIPAASRTYRERILNLSEAPNPIQTIQDDALPRIWGGALSEIKALKAHLKGMKILERDDAMQDLKTIAVTLRGIFRRPEMKALSQKYRQSLRENPARRDSQNESLMDFLNKVKQAFESELPHFQFLSQGQALEICQRMLFWSQTNSKY